MSPDVIAVHINKIGKNSGVPYRARDLAFGQGALLQLRQDFQFSIA